MSKLEDVKRMIERFEAVYRGANLEKFEQGPLYDLFPEKVPRPFDCERGWPQTWPSNGKPGVYVFLDDHLEILYIGKSSANSTVSARLASYCEYGTNRTCHLKHKTWKKSPSYVWIVGVPNETWFEAAALEEYLIRNLSTAENVVGI